jgi:hypothetical protein
MLEIARVCHYLAEHSIHQLRVRPTGNRRLLSPRHLGLRHHRHRIGNLRGFLDGRYPPSDVTGAGH